MILKGLGFNQRTRYLTPHFFQDKPVGRRLGEGIEARQLNDDRRGRTLDAMFRQGPTARYSQRAAQTVSRRGLLCRFGHVDATSFHVDGEYNRAVAPAEGVGVIHITPGYSPFWGRFFMLPEGHPAPLPAFLLLTRHWARVRARNDRWAGDGD